MDKKIVNILKSYGCGYMADDHKEMIEEIETYLKKREAAINFTQSCTELPNKMVIELSDEEMKIVSTEELIQMETEAIEFDGFEGWIVRGKAAILK